MNSNLPAPSQPPAPPDRPYVLLVEENREDMAMALRILKKYRIANLVVEAKSGEEALRFMRDRLSPAPSSGRSSATESTRIFSRARLAELTAAASLLPSLETTSRPSQPGVVRAVEPRAADGGHPPASGPARGRPPELVLLAYTLPRYPAPDLIRRLRALPGMENVPIAVCCRAPEEEKAVREAYLSRVSTLSKPIGFFKLLECIQRMEMHWQVFAEKPYGGEGVPGA